MRTRPFILTFAAVAALAGAAAAQTAPAPASPTPDAAAPPPSSLTPIPEAALTPTGDLLDTLKANSQFSILVKALDGSGLSSVLQRPGPFTLIAPTDAAFQALPPAELAELMKPENAGQLQQLLAYHLINAAVPPGKILGTKGAVATVASKDVEIDASVTPAKFDNADVEGQAHVSNGYIYVVDKVLTEPTAAAPGAAPAPAPGQ
jgi:uncharacterized surface protein with fasciclin (FAS1) repeats